MAQTENVKNSNTKNPAPQAKTREGFVKDDIALPPYWNPQEGSEVYAQPVMIDATDPTFVRFVMLAKETTACKRGPSDDAENVTVEAGERFTMSVYRGLEKPFFMYMVAGIPALITCVSKRKLAPSVTNPFPRTFWNFTSFMNAKDKQKLDANRVEFEKQALAQMEEKQKLLEAATEQAEQK